MSETKWSPGEWRILDVMNQRFVATPAYEGHPYFGSTRFVDIAGDEDYPRKDADLALIAVAPALYEALELVLDSLGALSNPSELGGMGLTDEQQARILSALPKARGESQ